jgi:hypothetical protein
MTVTKGGKIFWRALVWVFCLLALSGQPVLAAVTVTPLQMGDGHLVSMKIPHFDDGMAQTAMEQSNSLFQDCVEQAFQQFQELATAAWNSGLPESIKNGLTFRVDYEVFRNDERWVSLVQQGYQFTGGAHGMSWQKGFTFDTKAGRQVRLAALFVDGSAYGERLTQVVRREGAERKLPLWNFTGVGPDAAYYLTNEGLMLFYLPYEIAPYSSGTIRILVPYASLADILRPEVLQLKSKSVLQ